MREKERTTSYKGIYRLFDKNGNLIPNRYQIRVQAGKHPKTGRQLEIVKAFKGTLQEAVKRQREIATEAARRSVVTDRANLDELCLRYLEHAKEVLSESTWNGYRDYYNGKIKGMPIARRPVRDITTAELDDFLREYKRTGVKGQTVNHFRSFLMSLWRQAEAWQMVSFNAAEKTTSYPQEDFEYPVCDRERLERLFAHFRECDPLMLDLFQLKTLNQMRRGEICALRADDYDPLRRVLKIRRVVIERRGGGVAIKNTPKNHHKREINPLDELSIEILDRLIANKGESAYLFSDDGGVTPWRPGRVSQKMYRERSKAGVEFRVQDLRAYVTTLLNEKGHAKASQKRGGWEDQSVMQKHYSRYTDPAAAAAADVISEHFSKSG